MTKDSIESVDEYSKLNFDEIRIIGTLELPIKISWLSSLNSITVFRMKDEFFVSYNYEIKSLVKETKDLYEYYVRLFNLVEL